MVRASSNPKSANCPIPSKTNGDAGGGEEVEEEEPEPPLRRTTRLRTKTSAASTISAVVPTAIATTTTTTTSTTDVVENEINAETEKEAVEVVTNEEVDKKKKGKEKEKAATRRVSKRELDSINVSSESDVKTTSTARRSQRVVHKLSEVKSESVAARTRHGSKDFDVSEEQHHLFDCCFIRVTGDVYRRWKEVKKRLKFVRDEELVLYFLDLQSEDVQTEK